jgi:hypothetical protein
MTEPFLGFDELEAAQSQPEVTVNEALRTLAAAISIEVIDKDLTTPPVSPASTARYLVPAVGATGAWATMANKIAFLLGATWVALTPRVGWLVYVVDEGIRYEWSGSAWIVFDAGGGSITITGPDDSPPTTIADVTSIEFVNATVDDLGGGAARVTNLGGGGGTAENGNGPLTTVAIVSNVATMDHSLGGDFDLELTANVTTFTHANVASGQANWFTLRIHQDGTGGRTFAPPASWTYPSGVSAYTVSSGIGDIDMVQGVSYDNGTTWLISYEKDYV